MVNTELLNEVIDASGYKKGYIAEGVGITYNTFSLKLNNRKPFKLDEVKRLCLFLNIDDLELKDKIFFAD